MTLVEPVPTGSQLDISILCPGSRELPWSEEERTPALDDGKERHVLLQAWVEAGCPEVWEFPPKLVAPLGKLPRVYKHEAFPAVAEIYFWLDPVFETAGIMSTGRRPTDEEKPKEAHIFRAGTDAVGNIHFNGTDMGLGIVEWKGRIGSKWQIIHAAASAFLLAGQPQDGVVALQVFNPSGYVEPRTWLPHQITTALARLKLHAMEVLAQRAGFPPRYQTGEHCKYCRAYDACPKRDEATQYRPKRKRTA